MAQCYLNPNKKMFFFFCLVLRVRAGFLPTTDMIVAGANKTSTISTALGNPLGGERLKEETPEQNQ